jgi:ribosomal protein S18 acetylase RimI-like enzyme
LSQETGQLSLLKVPSSEIEALSEYSRLLWRLAYEPDLLSENQSQLLWNRGYASEALSRAEAVGESFFWIEQEGQRAGFIAHRYHADRRLFQLTRLYLHPDYWNQGIGAWCLAQIIRLGEQHQASRIEIYVLRTNARAIKAYRRAGFRLDREEWADFGGGIVYDDFVMALDLEPSDPDGPQ